MLDEFLPMNAVRLTLTVYQKNLVLVLIFIVLVLRTGFKRLVDWWITPGHFSLLNEVCIFLFFYCLRVNMQGSILLWIIFCQNEVAFFQLFSLERLNYTDDHPFFSN